MELATLSFGQRFEVTPMQMIKMTGTIANGGVPVTPRLVKATIDSETGEKVTCSFSDFHWPLSFTINQLAENDFKIVRMEEWPDIGFEKYNETKNELYPPNYCLVCE